MSQNMMDEEQYRKAFAEMVAAGASRTEMVEAFGLKDKDTVTRWKRDPRVKAIVSRLISDRALDVSRKVDSIIMGRLSQSDTLTTKELIDIRKEYGGAVAARHEIEDDANANQIMELMEKNPSGFDRLMRQLEGGKFDSNPDDGSDEPVDDETLTTADLD